MRGNEGLEERLVSRTLVSGVLRLQSPSVARISRIRISSFGQMSGQ